jgi:hypothetical protein
MTPTHQRTTRRFLLLGLLLPMATVASANAGTSLMWASLLHLTIGTLALGIGEGILLERFPHAKRFGAMELMIGANCLSSLAGAFGMYWLRGQALPLESYRLIFWGSVLLAFLITLVIEYPFVRVIFRGAPRPWRQSLWACLLVHLGSYLLILGWYALAVEDPLLRRVRVVSSPSITLPEPVSMTFLGQDGAVYTGSLTDRNWTRVSDSISSNLFDRVVFQPRSQSAGHPLNATVIRSHLDQDGAVYTEGLLDRKWTRILDSLSTIPLERVAFQPQSDSAGEHYETTVIGSQDELWTSPMLRLGDSLTREQIPLRISYDEWLDAGFIDRQSLAGRHIPRIGSAKPSYIVVRHYHWHGLGFKGGLVTTGEESINFYVDSPLLGNPVREAFHLPGDLFLFQMGRDNICLYDPSREELAVIARGWGPVVFQTTATLSRLPASP